MKHLILWISVCILFTLIGCTDKAPAPQEVVVTIKPIHALVSSVMEGIGTPRLLLSGGESPHSYSLRPSQVRRLHTASVVIWVGPSVETFLEKTLSTLSDKTHILRLIELPGLNLLKVREGEAWETQTFHHEDSHHHHAAFEIDPHIWLDIHNAKIMVQAIAQSLSQNDAKNADRYIANAARLTKRLDQLDETLKRQLAPIKHLPYLVFHDAYQYFERRYGLTAVGAISLSPETRPSVKRLHELRARLKNQQVRCVFSEPQFESALVETLIEDSTVRRGILDPLGTGTVGRGGYFSLLGNLASSLNQCLLDQ